MIRALLVVLPSWLLAGGIIALLVGKRFKQIRKRTSDPKYRAML